MRRTILAKRGQISDETRRMKSKLIVERLLQHPLYQQCQYLFTFVPFGHEVNIRPLIEQAKKDGKKVAIPHVDTVRKEMTIYQFEGWDRLVPGVYGILEPDPLQSQKVIPDHLDLILVPGVGFDRKGGRLGYGGGFYDRFIAKFSASPFLLAPCFAEQMVDQIPLEQHDFRVDFVITDREIINCRN